MSQHSIEILLINPNFMKPPVTPVAIDFLAAALRAGGYNVTFLDLAFEDDINAALEHELWRDFLFVGLSIRNIDDSFFGRRDFCLARLTPVIQKIRSLTLSPVVVGGVGYSIFPMTALEYCGADYGIQGDGEVAIVRLADALSRGSISLQIPGLIWKQEDTYRSNPPVHVDLSAIDLSDRGTVDNLRYFNEGGMVGFETKRGCNASCSYCADPPAKGTTTRERRPDEVAREIARLAAMGIDHFQTCDSEFNVPHPHAVEVCRSFIRAGLGDRIRWYAYMTPSFFDDELASLMRKAGCVGIDFGADHSNQNLLNVLGRSHNADSLKAAARLCRKHGMECMFDLLVGAPGETASTLREVIEFMKKMEPSCVGVSMGVRIYPRTRLARNLGPQLRQGARGFYGVDSADSESMEFLRPAYYLSPDLGENPHQLLQNLIGGDERFFFESAGDVDFNYNDNFALVEAIRSGERGTFWDILRRLRVRAKSETHGTG